MEINGVNKVQDAGRKLRLMISGKVDTLTAPRLEEAILEKEDGITDLILDFSGVEYISSAGLRVLLSAQKRMAARGGGVVIKGAGKVVKEVFTITGFSDILTME